MGILQYNKWNVLYNGRDSEVYTLYQKEWNLQIIVEKVECTVKGIMSAMYEKWQKGQTILQIIIKRVVKNYNRDSRWYI